MSDQKKIVTIITQEQLFNITNELDKLSSFLKFQATKVDAVVTQEPKSTVPPEAPVDPPPVEDKA